MYKVYHASKSRVAVASFNVVFVLLLLLRYAKSIILLLITTPNYCTPKY